MHFNYLRASILLFSIPNSSQGAKLGLGVAVQLPMTLMATHALFACMAYNSFYLVLFFWNVFSNTDIGAYWALILATY